MKVHVLFNAAAMALAATSTAAVAADSNTRTSGHYEWRQVPQFGPKAPLTVPRRVWVADRQEMANCDCDMMKMSADECMKSMHHMRSPSADGSAS